MSRIEYGSRVRALRIGVLAATLSVAAAPAASLAPPRPLTAAEVEAVRLASEYLAGGPEALWPLLSAGSALRDLGREAGLAEIEVRLGSPAGARWELRTPPRGFPSNRVIFSIEQPSGLDQAVILGMAPDVSGYRLRSVRSLSEPPLPLEAGVGENNESERSSESRGILGVAVCCAVAALALAAIVPLRGRRAVAAALAATAIAAASIAVWGIVRLEPSAKAGKPEALERVVRLGHVLSERRRLEAGETVELRPGEAPGDLLVRIWAAQLAQQRGETEKAVRALSAVPRADRVPWADLLRGRLSFMSKNGAESVAAYQRLIDEGLYHDGLLAEALDAFAILGYPTGREWSLEKLVGLGSRSADVQYLLARELASYPRLGNPVEAFQTGWALRPMERSSLFGAGRLWDHLRRPEVLAGLRLGDSAPQAGGVVASERSFPPLATRAELRVCGRSLRMRFESGAELVVPGGADLAPDGTTVEDPDAERDEEASRVLAGLPGLTERLRDPGALSQPALRRQLERAAVELANRHRWAEVATLSAGYSGSIEQAPPLVVLLRAEALRRTRRAEAGAVLLRELEKNPALDRLGNPGLLLALSDMLRSSGDLAGAIRVAERAHRMRPVPYLRYLLATLKAEQELEAGFETQVVDRFDLRYRSGANVSGPIEVGKILKAEWARMAPWFPGLAGRTVVVDLLPYLDFARTYGTEVLGLYDGKIRVPVFGVPRFTPPIVSILSHELAHAMIADATDDRAPSWLHEGLAQRLEMRPERVNRVADLVRDGTYLSIRSLEEVLRNRPDPDLVEAAYVESEWLVHFLERRWGRKAISRLLETYRAGGSTEEAVAAATSLSLAELDRRFRDWALGEAPKSLADRVVVRYDVETR